MAVVVRSRVHEEQAGARSWSGGGWKATRCGGTPLALQALLHELLELLHLALQLGDARAQRLPRLLLLLLLLLLALACSPKLWAPVWPPLLCSLLLFGPVA